MEGTQLYQGFWEKGENLFDQETSFFFSGLRAMCKRRLWKRASFSIGAPLGDLEEGSFTGWLWETAKEGSGNGASVSMVALWGEAGGRAPLLWIPKNTWRKALEKGVFLHMAPLWKGRKFTRDFERKVRFCLIRRTFLLGTPRDV
jgi:hypothetical protein